jgi:ATP-binding cassette subfamily B protein
MQVIMAFMLLISIFIMLPRTSVAARRISEVLNTESIIKDGNRTMRKGPHSGELEFRNVSFKYPDSDEYAIKNISFKANKGETIAFIGSTGCGKTTLINLIPRFFDVSKGEILIDGVNVKEYSEESLNNKKRITESLSIIDEFKLYEKLWD